MTLITNSDRKLIFPYMYFPLAIVEKISDENKEL